MTSPTHCYWNGPNLIRNFLPTSKSASPECFASAPASCWPAWLRPAWPIPATTTTTTTTTSGTSRRTNSEVNTYLSIHQNPNNNFEPLLSVSLCPNKVSNLHSTPFLSSPFPPQSTPVCASPRRTSTSTPPACRGLCSPSAAWLTASRCVSSRLHRL